MYRLGSFRQGADGSDMRIPVARTVRVSWCRSWVALCCLESCPYLATFLPSDNSQITRALVRYELEYARKAFNIVLIFPVYTILQFMRSEGPGEDLALRWMITIYISSSYSLKQYSPHDFGSLFESPEPGSSSYPRSLKLALVNVGLTTSRPGFPYGAATDPEERDVVGKVLLFFIMKRGLTVRRAECRETVEVWAEIAEGLVDGSEYIR
jgi:hypothetical protein